MLKSWRERVLRMRPPITTTWPERALTILSLSRISLKASGIISVTPATVSALVWSRTSLTVGWMCRMIVPSAEICGVTSSAMPEKNGVSSTSRLVVEAVPVTVLLDMSVTKNSSEPALMTAFWLLSVATRGLDSTRALP